ncbi:MAG: DUF99 family protein [Halorhabdus sp.]
MKQGVRALGIAESFTGERSTLAGAVVRASRVVDGFVFGSCTVGGTDVNETIVEMVERLDRADVQYLFVAGIAPAWFNMVDVPEIHAETGLPVLSVTFEESDGLASALRAEFDGQALDRRLRVYRSQPDRERVLVNDQPVFVRSMGCDTADPREVLGAFTPEGGRPEPLRVARLAARAVEQSPLPGSR